MQAIAITPRLLAQDGTSVRQVATLIIVATLPLTYAMTLRIVYPIKIYDFILVLAAACVLWEGRLIVAPGLARFSTPILLLLGWSTAVLCFRFALPLDSFTTEGFSSRIGPIGDAVVKLSQWLLALLAFAMVATATYEDERRVGRWWCIGANIAAVYGWLLTLSSVFNLPAPLLPGMIAPHTVNIAGRYIFRGGTFEEGNFFGMYLLMSLAIALWLRWRWTAVLMATTVFITFSTASVFALFLCGGMYAWGVGSPKRDTRIRLYTVAGYATILIGVLTVLVVTGYLETFFIDKLATEEYGSKIDRANLAIAGLRMAAEHPILGVGLSHYGFNWQQYQLTDLLDQLREGKAIANSPWIELVAETGIVGFAFVVTFARRLWMHASGYDGLAFRTGLFAMGLGLMTFPSFTVVFLWAFCGVVVGVRLRRDHDESTCAAAAMIRQREFLCYGIESPIAQRQLAVGERTGTADLADGA